MLEVDKKTDFKMYTQASINKAFIRNTEKLSIDYEDFKGKLASNKEFLSYLVGFSYTDGNYYEQSRNRGKYSYELHIRDIDILNKIQEKLICHSSIRERKRETNFKNSHTGILSFYDMEIRRRIRFYEGKAMYLISIGQIEEKDFLRAVIEADGSFGLLKDGRPFLSICITEEELKELYVLTVYKITGKIKNSKRNKRDNVYNIMVYSEDAQLMLDYIYSDSGIHMDRKFSIYQEVSLWKRDEKTKRVYSKSWSKDEEEYILNHSVAESMIRLNRTEKSIKSKLFKLKASDKFVKTK